MIKAIINFCQKNTEKVTNFMKEKELYFTITDFLEDEANRVTPYHLTFRIYREEYDEQIEKDMDTIYKEFSKNIHMVKEMLGYRLYNMGVISNGYDIRCISTLGDILNRYIVSVDMQFTMFIINGHAQNGKDTFIKLIEKHYKDIRSFSTIDPIRDILPVLDIDISKKTEQDRLLLSNIKAAIMKYDPCWSSNQVYAFEKAIKNSPFYRYILFVHCREKQDIDMIKRLGAYTILIKNNHVAPIISNESDKNVLNCDYDFIIDNNDDLEFLEEKARKFTEAMRHFCYN